MSGTRISGETRNSAHLPLARNYPTPPSKHSTNTEDTAGAHVQDERPTHGLDSSPTLDFNISHHLILPSNLCLALSYIARRDIATNSFNPIPSHHIPSTLKRTLRKPSADRDHSREPTTTRLQDGLADKGRRNCYTTESNIRRRAQKS